MIEHGGLKSVNSECWGLAHDLRKGDPSEQVMAVWPRDLFNIWIFFITLFV